MICKIIIKLAILALIMAGGPVPPASADVLIAEPDQYHLVHKAHSKLSPAKLWARLVEPAIWWQANHTYSGDSANLSLDLRAGGLWQEKWSTADGEHSIAHGQLLAVMPHKQLRLNAPFGPLQALPVTVIWTITLTPAEDGGTNIQFDERATGTSSTGLDKLAPAVDYVKAEAMKSLAGAEN